MANREKLIELLKDSPSLDALDDDGYAIGADHLIANGVRLEEKQATSNPSEKFATDNNVGGKWIPVTERLPEKCEPVLACFDFMGGKAVKASDRYGKNGLLWSGIPCGGKVTHWMELPEPPKGE